MLKYFLNILTGLNLIGYLLIAFSYVGEQKKHITSNEVKIILHENEFYKFMTNESIHSILKENNIHKLGNNIYQINKEYIEHILKKNLYIKEVEVYIDANFKMNIEVKQVEPLFRVISDNNTFYVDKDRNILPISSNVYAYVHVVIGKVTHKMAKNELFDLFTKVENDKFWNSQLDHIRMNDMQEAQLFVKLGSPKVNFGKLENIDEKLRNLFAFYKHTLKTKDLSNYSMIDVRFKNQVICKKINL